MSTSLLYKKVKAPNAIPLFILNVDIFWSKVRSLTLKIVGNTFQVYKTHPLVCM